MTTPPNVPLLVSAHLSRLARRVEDDPFFLASALRDYARDNGIGAQALADRLGCAVETLPQLALCRRPVPATFDHDIATIAARFGIDPRVLTIIVGNTR